MNKMLITPPHTTPNQNPPPFWVFTDDNLTILLSHGGHVLARSPFFFFFPSRDFPFDLNSNSPPFARHSRVTCLISPPSPHHPPTVGGWDRPFVEMGAGLRHGVGEAQLEVLAAQRVLPVVLDQGDQAGKVQVGRQVIVGASLLRAHANAAVLDPPAAPETHTGNDQVRLFRNPHKAKKKKKVG